MMAVYLLVKFIMRAILSLTISFHPVSCFQLNPYYNQYCCLGLAFNEYYHWLTPFTSRKEKKQNKTWLLNYVSLKIFWTNTFIQLELFASIFQCSHNPLNQGPIYVIVCMLLLHMQFVVLTNVLLLDFSHHHIFQILDI